jgi:hypothetical protein
MKIVLPIFAIAAGVLAAQWLGAADPATISGPDFRSEGAPITARQPGDTEALQTSASSAEAISPRVPADNPASNQATAVLERAIATLAAATSVSARLRHRIHLFEHELIGSGLYEQQGQGNERRVRMELKIQIGDKLASQLQVVDDRFLWTYQDTLTGPLITQLDLKRVANAEQKAYGQSTLSNGNSAIGGLPKLLTGLRDNFVFTKVEAGYLGASAVWALEGNWRPDRLSALFPDQQVKSAAGDVFDFEKQPQLPERVIVFITQETMFLQRIEYHRRSESVADDKNSGFAPVITLEFFDIRFNEPIDAPQFIYEPGPQPVAEVTDSYLQTRGLVGSK